MNRGKVKDLAKEAGIDWHGHWDIGGEENQLERFAALVEKESSYPALGALELLLMMIQPVVNISGIDPESVRMTFSKEGKEFGSVTILDGLDAMLVWGVHNSAFGAVGGLGGVLGFNHILTVGLRLGEHRPAFEVKDVSHLGIFAQTLPRLLEVRVVVGGDVCSSSLPALQETIQQGRTILSLCVAHVLRNLICLANKDKGNLFPSDLTQNIIDACCKLLKGNADTGRLAHLQPRLQKKVGWATPRVKAISPVCMSVAPMLTQRWSRPSVARNLATSSPSSIPLVLMVFMRSISSWLSSRYPLIWRCWFSTLIPLRFQNSTRNSVL